MPKVEKVCQMLRKYKKVSKKLKSVLKAEKVWKSVPKAERVWKSVLKIEKCVKSWESVKKVCQMYRNKCLVRTRYAEWCLSERNAIYPNAWSTFGIIWFGLLTKFLVQPFLGGVRAVPRTACCCQKWFFNKFFQKVSFSLLPRNQN